MALPEKTAREGRGWLALLVSIPIALLATAALELLAIPGESLASGGGALSYLSAYCRLGLELLLLFRVHLLALAGQVLLLAMGEGAPKGWKRALAAGVVLLGLLHAYLLHRSLTAGTHLGEELLPAAALAFAGAALGLLTLLLWLPPERLRPARLILGLLLTLGLPLLALLNLRLLVGLYTPSAALAFAGALSAALGLALLLQDRMRERARVIAAAVIAAGLCVALAGAAVEGPREALYLHTSIGRAALAAQAIKGEGAALLPDHRGADAGAMEEARALDLFARRSGLPSLPEGFSLAGRDVFLVLSESFRYDQSSLADPTLRTTEALASFVEREGALSFSRASSPSSATFLSLASIFSMTYPSLAELEIKPRFWRGRLRGGRATIAERMRRSGRRTLWVGHDFHHCFSQHFRGLDRGFSLRRRLHTEPDGDPRIDARIADASIEAIRSARAHEAPIFGLIFFASPHDQYQVHEADRPAGTPLERYRQELRAMDAQLGRVLEEITRGPRGREAVVIVSGDHGEAFGEHRLGYHASSVHAEQIHVPLVLRVPGLRGGERRAPTSSLYVLPWLLLRGRAALEEGAREAIASDLGPMFQASDGAVIAELLGRRHLLAALRYPQHTVIYDLLGDVARLYDAESDPLEQRDLAPTRPDLAGRYRRRWTGYRRARLRRQRFFFLPTP